MWRINEVWLNKSVGQIVTNQQFHLVQNVKISNSTAA